MHITSRNELEHSWPRIEWARPYTNTLSCANPTTRAGQYVCVMSESGLVWVSLQRQGRWVCSIYCWDTAPNVNTLSKVTLFLSLSLLRICLVSIESCCTACGCYAATVWRQGWCKSSIHIRAMLMSSITDGLCVGFCSNVQVTDSPLILAAFGDSLSACIVLVKAWADVSVEGEVGDLFRKQWGFLLCGPCCIG